MADVKATTNGTNNSTDKLGFICGVVEGFYGRPWTPEQRKDLFCKLEKWTMNCYLYAPKDDYKHRAYWRELYTVEEAEHLQALIAEATSNNIVFYYAISPGLDIAYSSQKEIGSLKRKLEQVKQLGCNAFALLFDDIDPEMSGPDKEVYQSFAHAQVSVANEIYTHLDQPKFMFCPTQYCSSRAVPTVQTSEYLNTLGSKLAPEIDIMWTGPKVVSKILSEEHIREISSVIRRPPVIWDNLHANDYDQARLFLGPYSGRSPNIIPLLRGVVTNPNCEYGPNFVAIHTLAQWSKSESSEGSQLKDDAVSADIRLETEGDDSSSSCPSGYPSDRYHPKRALKIALEEWLIEFGKNQIAAGPLQQPQVTMPIPLPIVPSVNTCMSLTSTTPVNSSLPIIAACNVSQVAEAMNDSAMIPATNIVMNSLVSETKVDTIDPLQLAEATPTPSSDTTKEEEPMECSIPPSSAASDDQMMVDSKTSSDGSEKIEDTCVGSSSLNPDMDLTVEDLLLLADLFYLPFEHGKKGISILTEFNWLKSNSHLVIEHNRNNPDGTRKPEVQEWFDKAGKFADFSKSVRKLSDRLFNVRNRSLLYELYPYVWDMRGVISLLNSYVQWLALGYVSTLVSRFVLGNYTWFSKGWKEAFMSGDQEPWIFRGGLTAELQRLIPVDASHDLFIYKAPETSLNKCYVIRPYMESDRESLYALFLATCDDGKDGSSLYEAHPNLPAEVALGSLLTPEAVPSTVLMLVEDETGALVGYCCANVNVKEHAKTFRETIIALREKYPKVVQEEGTMLTPCEQLLGSLWGNDLFPTLCFPPVSIAASLTPPPLPTIAPSTTTPGESTSDVSDSPPSLTPSPPTNESDVMVNSGGSAQTPLTPSPTPSPDTGGPLLPGTAPAATSMADILSYYPALLKLRLCQSVIDESISKRLLTCVLAALRSKGGFGGHCTVLPGDSSLLMLYSKLGFTQISSVSGRIYLTRTF